MFFMAHPVEYKIRSNVHGNQSIKVYYSNPQMRDIEGLKEK